MIPHEQITRSLRDPKSKNYFSLKFCFSLDVEWYRINDSCCSLCEREYVSCSTQWRIFHDLSSNENRCFSTADSFRAERISITTSAYKRSR